MILAGCTQQVSTPDSQVKPHNTPDSTHPKFIPDIPLLIDGYTVGDQISQDSFHVVSTTNGLIPLDELRHNTNPQLYIKAISSDVAYEIVKQRIHESELNEVITDISRQLDCRPDYKPMPDSAPHWAFESYTWMVGSTEAQLLRASYLGEDRFGRKFMDRGWTLYYRDHEVQRRLAEFYYFNLP